MKVSGTRYTGGIALLILAMAVVLGHFILFEYPSSVFPVGHELGECDFIQPSMGRFECEPLSHDETYSQIYFEGDRKDTSLSVSCGDNENSPSCGGIYINCQKGVLDFTFVEFQADGVGPCPIGGGNWCRNAITVDTYIQIVSKRQLGSRFRVRGCFDDYLVTRQWHPGTLREYSLPYGLNVYDSGGKYRYNAKSCSVRDIGDYKNVCTSTGSNCTETIFNTANGKDISNTYVLGFDDWVNYLSSWVYAPVDVNNKIVTYKGETGYCQPAGGGKVAIYSIGKFDTIGGCYAYPEKISGYEDCCPGMESANAICENDFRWHTKIVGECDLNRPCPSGYNCQENKCVRIVECSSVMQCTGQGAWVTDYSEEQPTRVKYGCVDGNCNVVDIERVDCVPPKQGCSSGMLCDPYTFKCVQPTPNVVCGDGVCSTGAEDSTTCPKDCPPVNCEEQCKASYGAYDPQRYICSFECDIVGLSKYGLFFGGLAGIFIFGILFQFLTSVGVMKNLVYLLSIFGGATAAWLLYSDWWVALLAAIGLGVVYVIIQGVTSGGAAGGIIGRVIK